MITDDDLKRGQEIYELLIGSATAEAFSILSPKPNNDEVLLMANKELYKYFENEFENYNHEIKDSASPDQYLICAWRCRIEIGKILNKNKG